MISNESNATRRIVGPIPFYGLDGKFLAGLDFKTALGHVLVAGDGSNWAAAAGDVTTNAGNYWFTFSQSETNKKASIAVRLIRPGTSGTSTATAANSLTNSAAAMATNQYKGQYLKDSAGTLWLISSHTATVFTLGGTGTPASGAYTVIAYEPTDYQEPIEKSSINSGVITVGGLSGGTFSRSQFTIDTASSPSTFDDFYNGALVSIVDDTVAANIGAFAVVGDYDGTSKILTLAGTGFPVTPSSNTKIAIARGANAVSADYVREFIDGNMKLEAPWTPGDIIRLMVSILAGKVSDFRTGTLAFRDLLDTKTRWTVVTDPSGRISLIPGNLT